jgi:hypothetical protein
VTINATACNFEVFGKWNILLFMAQKYCEFDWDGVKMRKQHCLRLTKVKPFASLQWVQNPKRCKK